MSDSDGFLTRWSRRKRQAASEPETPAAATAPPIPAEKAASLDGESTRSPEPEPAVESEPADQVSLPPIESIDAVTDIRAFLAKGVPPDLARAALRQAWRTDPAIRDFVGLADYDWDFNAPNSMPGFGPLLPTDDVGRLLRQMLGNEEPRVAESSSKPESPAETPDQGDPVTIVHPADSQPADDSPANMLVGTADRIPSSDDGSSQVTPHDPDIAMQNPPAPVRRSHGGALPE
jgi:hypothetical protein